MKNKKRIQILVQALSILIILFLFILTSCDDAATKGITMATNPPVAVAKDTTNATTTTSLFVSWVAGALDAKHLSKTGVTLTEAELNYKVYYIKKGTGTRDAATVKKDAQTIKPAQVKYVKTDTRVTIDKLTADTEYEIVIETINLTDTTKISLSTVLRQKTATLTTPNPATALTADTITSNSIALSWTAGDITDVKKDNGTALIQTDIIYKVYYVEKGVTARATATQVLTDTPTTQIITVTNGALNTSITGLTADTNYEIVVEAINSTDDTKTTSTVLIQKTIAVTGQATLPPLLTIEPPTGSLKANSIDIRWTPQFSPNVFNDDGTVTTSADLIYTIYYIRKSINKRTPAQVKTAARATTTPQVISLQAGTKTTTIANLTVDTRYEIVVETINSTDITKTRLSSVKVFETK